LDKVLDFDITEFDFWNMTLREIENSIRSKLRVRKMKAQEKATYDYIQATLIIKGVGIALGSKDDFPGIEETYQGIFGDLADKKQDELQEKKDELSALRFRQFAQSYNNKFV
jgi:hypothetical protein